jgi:hypothetical protein
MFLFYTYLYFSFLRSQEEIIYLIWVVAQKVRETLLYFKNKHMKNEGSCGVAHEYCDSPSCQMKDEKKNGSRITLSSLVDVKRSLL